MGNAGSCLKRCVMVFSSLLLVVMCFGTVGCSLFKSNAAQSDADRTIWHSREQNVRIVKQEVVKGGVVTQNDHPIILDSGQIRSALSFLEVRPTEAEKPIPVFTAPELDVLCGKLSEALAQAGPDEDVTFAVVGQRKALYGLARQRKVTTGRVFYREGKLNIIFGKMVDDINEENRHDYRADNDFRLNPLTPGSRIRPVSHKWVLEEQPDAQFHASGGMIRSDWLVLDLATMTAHEALGVKPAKLVKAPLETPGSPLKETVPQESRREAGTSEPAPSASSAAKPGKTIEERLTILNNLRDKKLITDDEYKAKRNNILNEL
jgi:hypothetical protein